MGIEAIGGLLAFGGLFTLFVVLPSKLRNKSRE